MQSEFIRHCAFLMLFSTFQQEVKVSPFSSWSRKAFVAAVALNLTSSFRSFSCK